jgi:hypothetical protein
MERGEARVMTIAIAVACSEGVVLVSDSMTIRGDDRGNCIGALLSAEGKRGLLGGFAYVLSGGWPVGRRLKTPPVGISFAEGARMLNAEFAANQGPELRSQLTGDPARAGAKDVRFGNYALYAEMIVCCAPLGDAGARQLAIFNDQGERFFDIAEGAVVVAGSPRFWALENGVTALTGPETLPEAEHLAVRIASQYIKDWYQGRSLQQIIDSGTLPPVAYPLNGFTVSSSRVSDWAFQPLDTELLGSSWSSK